MPTNPITRSLLSNYKWLKKRGYASDDIVVDYLADPTTSIQGKQLISFCSNNYLGLSKRKSVIEEGKKALLEHGIGTCESRRLGGDIELLEILEDEISSFIGSEDSMIFATGLLANVGIISGIADATHYTHTLYGRSKEQPETVVIGDALIHWSLRMGIKLSKAKLYRYKHNDMEDLERLLDEHKGKHILLVTDGVFSMDGDVAPLKTITKLAKEYKAAIMVDDSHATGIFGENGKGTTEHFGVMNKVDFHMSTLGKSFAGIGGYIAANKDCIDMLKNSTATYIFTSSLPAEQAAAITEAIRIVKREPELRVHLWKNVYSILQGLRRIGVPITLQGSPIIPIIIGDEVKAYKVEKYFLDNGILCCAVTPPAVAHGKARLRCSINATHTQAHINHFLEVMEAAVKEFSLPIETYDEHEWKQFVKSTPSYIAAMIKAS